jgi:hypothetical protein
MSVRLRSSTVPANIYSAIGVWNGVPTLYPATGDATSHSSEDYVTPDYKGRIAQGIIINSPCSMTGVSRTSSAEGLWDATRISDGSTLVVSGSLCSRGLFYDYVNYGRPSLTNSLIADDDIRLTRVASSKLDAIANIDSTPFKFGEDIFELRKTLQFIRRPFSSLRDLTRKMNDSHRVKYYVLKRRKSFTPGAAAKLLSDTWLEYRFAISPLVRSGFSAALAMENPKIKTSPRKIARGSGFDQVTDNSTSDRPGGSGRYKHYSIADELNLVVRSGIMYEVSNPVQNYQRTLGLRLKDLPEVLWAITPYSFMVDRVVNITNSVRGLTNLKDPDVSILAGWSVQKVNAVRRITHTGDTQPAYSLNSFKSSVTVTDVWKYDRVVWDPSVSDLIPPFSLSGLIKDATKTLDLATLVYNQLSGPRRRTYL